MHTSPYVDFKKASTAFTNIYEKNYWGEGSGASSVNDTQPYMDFIRSFMHGNDIKSIVDVGCGDWQFSRYIDWSGLNYTGYDVVESVIGKNNIAFPSDNINFRLLTAIHELPPADLLLCKDVLQHLPNEEINAYLRFFLYNYKFALVTNDGAAADVKEGIIHPISGDAINCEINHGEWRMVKPNISPFNIPSAKIFEWKVSCSTMLWTKQTYLLIRPF